jgi:hypothetical protein
MRASEASASMLKGSRKFLLIQPMARLICGSLLSPRSLPTGYEAGGSKPSLALGGGSHAAGRPTENAVSYLGSNHATRRRPGRRCGGNSPTAT